jgi:hypothetical protein
LKKIWIGIDNGVSGSIGFVGDIESEFFLTPIKNEMSFQKSKKSKINRIDFKILFDKLKEIKDLECSVHAFIERPMINPTRFQASISAARSLESTLIILELLEIPYEYIDSKQWQKVLLPAGIKGSEEQKKASKDIGIRLFPEHKTLIEKHKDADGILIAEWARRAQL